MSFVSAHLDVFIDHYNKMQAAGWSPERLEGAWQGRSAQAWLASVNKQGAIVDIDEARLSTKALTRGDLRDRVAAMRRECTDEDVLLIVIEILAWGGMQVVNGRRALSCKDDWISTCRELLESPQNNPVIAYSRFLKLHQAHKIQSIGPAYYTKLIHFLGSGGGLIMDQWTARSINLLIEGGGIIKMQRGARGRNFVDPSNTADVYSRYLVAVDELRGLLEKASSQVVGIAETEALLFSLSPLRKPASMNKGDHELLSFWRGYVMNYGIT